MPFKCTVVSLNLGNSVQLLRYIIICKSLSQNRLKASCSQHIRLMLTTLDRTQGCVHKA